MNQSEDSHLQSLEKLGDSLKNADLDYKFAQLFTHSGGIFNYCADESEALQTLNKIVKIEGISSAFCCDPDLQKFLDVINVSYDENLELFHDVAFITCEYLIAYDGRIMLSHNNIKHFHSSRLPEKVIIMANLSQIATNLNEAMAKIKRNGNFKNLTSISGSQNKLDSSSGNATKLFLLLIED
ncbi:hypothetical protein HNQ03_000042 [Chryseobacterium sp. 16F]|uniref:LUD domain-containing protein n=2 Tax=Frigoriflavimonas asaccharolytica TaxID=2735899 RepID=A0A8J8K7I1_9FLAO|nr:hypothetical protein [Frigoriflavimonas asaccharolytica]